jgi:DNA-binding transcriptional LysR family regulator
MASPIKPSLSVLLRGLLKGARFCHRVEVLFVSEVIGFLNSRMEQPEHISRRVKLRQLEVLVAVARWGNMAKAAEELAITQPVVSKTIADLEGALGIRLFDRDRRGVELTLYGRALLKRSVTLFNDLRAGITELQFLSDPTAGELRIGSSDAVASGMLAAIINRLSRRHPQLSFEVSLGGGLTDLQYRELQAHNLDLVIGRLPNTVPDDLDVETLYHDAFLVVTGKQNNCARHRKIKLGDLINEPWCLPSLESYPWTLIADALRTAGLDLPRRIVTARSVLLLISLIETGSFFTMLPRTVVHFHRRASLKIWPASLPIRPYPVGIVTLKGRTLSPVTQVFIDCAREIARPLAKASKQAPSRSE